MLWENAGPQQRGHKQQDECPSAITQSGSRQTNQEKRCGDVSRVNAECVYYVKEIKTNTNLRLKVCTREHQSGDEAVKSVAC